jgi:restriction endonuclease S subunit
MIDALTNLDKSSWGKHRFDEIAMMVSERVDPNNTDLKIYVGLEHLDSENLHIRSHGTPDDVNGTKLRFYKGDVIFGRRRAYQRKAAIAEYDGFCSAHALVLRAKPEVIDPALFPFFLHSDQFMHRAVDISVGSLSPTINWKSLRKQEFLLPPKPEQARLAELLWAGDLVLEGLDKIKRKVKAVRLSYRERELSNSGKPVALEKILESITAGKSLKGRNIQSTTSEGAVLKVSAVGPEGFDASEVKILEKQDEFMDRFQIYSGDLLITRANTSELVGRVCLVDKDYPNYMLCDKTLRLNTIEKKSNTLLHEVMLSRRIRRQIESYATGTSQGMKNITQDEIRSIRVPNPSKEFQCVAQGKINQLVAVLYTTVGKLASTRALQKSLIHQIF